MSCSGYDCKEGILSGNEGTTAETEVLVRIWQKLTAEVDIVLNKLCVVGYEERIWKPSLRMCLHLGRPG